MAQAVTPLNRDPQLDALKLPPHSLEAEQSVLGGLLLDNEAWEKIGDVLRDNVHYLSRCGFDSFALRADQNPAAALTAFNDFTNAYQSAVDKAPLFRRRPAAAAARRLPPASRATDDTDRRATG